MVKGPLQRVANGTGTVRREYALGRKRTDLYLEWDGDDNRPGQRIVIELKMLRKTDWRQKVFKETAEYNGMKFTIWGM